MSLQDLNFKIGDILSINIQKLPEKEKKEIKPYNKMEWGIIKSTLEIWNYRK